MGSHLALFLARPGRYWSLSQVSSFLPFYDQSETDRFPFFRSPFLLSSLGFLRRWMYDRLRHRVWCQAVLTLVRLSLEDSWKLHTSVTLGLCSSIISAPL